MTAISTGGAHGGGNMGMGAGGTTTVSGSGGGRHSGPYLASSFGVRATTLGRGFGARSFLNSERVRELARRESYYKCTHHDWKTFDFDGRMIPPGAPTSQPMLSAESASWYVPLRLRRPTSPYRLARIIVNSFTSLLFGHGRWPTLRVHGDEQTEDFCRALAEASGLRTVMLRARNIGGSVGTVGLSWRFYEGKPKVQTHNGRHLYVHKWIDREEMRPEHVSEVYTYPRDVYDSEKNQYVRKWFWYRRDWTPLADVAFFDVEYENDRDPEWKIDEERTAVHEDGEPHFIWIQNLPEDDGASVDGQPDYAELYENFESIDLLKSVVVRGATLNLDPTLVLKMDPDIAARTGLKKGSDNALFVGTGGDAHYMELQGTSISMGVDLIKQMRDAALEAAQCVVPDPNQVGSAAHSSPALKVIYEPMLAKGEVLRDTYGAGLKRLLSQMLAVARERMEDVEIEIDDDGAEREVHQTLDLPPRTKVVPIKDGDGMPTGEERIEVVERAPGKGGTIELDWGDYFNPTTDDIQKAINTMQMAATGKVMSQQSAVEEVAALFEREPRSEWKRIIEEAKRAIDAAAGTFGDGMGGDVDGIDDLPPGAEPEPERGVNVPGDGGSKLELTATDLATITTVNEGRKSVGLQPLKLVDGGPDPDGDLTIAEFNAKKEAKGGVTGEGEGQEETGEAPGAPGAPGAPPGGAPPAPPAV